MHHYYRVMLLAAAIVVMVAVVPRPVQSQDDAPTTPIIGALLIAPTTLGRIQSAQLDTSTQAIYAYAANADQISVFSAVDGSPTTSYALPSPTDGLVWGAGGRLAAWQESALYIYDGYGARLHLSLTAPQPIAGVVFAQTQAWLFSYHANGNLIVWDTLEGDILHTTIWRYPIDDVALSPDDSQLLLGSWQGAAALYDLNAQAFTAAFTHDTRALVGGVFSGDAVVSWGFDGSLRWPDSMLAVGGQLWQVDAIGSALWAWVGDGRLLQIDPASRRLQHTYAHPDRMTSYALRGDRLLTTSGNGTAYLWDTTSGVEVVRLGGAATVYGGVWSSDGAQILTWDADGVLRVFAAITESACFITAPANANQRDAPSTSGAFVGTLAANTGRYGVAQATDASGFRWYQLDTGAWVREDVVRVLPACTTLAVLA